MTHYKVFENDGKKSRAVLMETKAITRAVEKNGETKKMKEFLKDLRNENNESLINKLNYNQQKYNKWFDIYKCDKNEAYSNRVMSNCLNNINKIKQVFKERKVNIEFKNGWEIIKQKKRGGNYGK